MNKGFYNFQYKSSYSTEKIDNFNFNLFYKYYKKHIKNNEIPCFQFLTWLIGFTEGDGSFIKAKRGDLYFVIVQDTRDVQVLYMIQSILGFGKIIKQGKTTSRYIVQDKLGLYLISLIFNNNIVLPSNLKKFQKFLIFVNKYNSKGRLLFSPIENNNTTVLFTLNDSWLLGFTDAEGCFSASINLHGKFKIIFDMSQKKEKNILEHISKLFNVGSVVKHSVSDVWSFRVSGLKNCKLLMDYYDNFQLRSKKFKSYLLWKYFHEKITKKQHLDKSLIYSLKTLASKINNIWE